MRKALVGTLCVGLLLTGCTHVRVSPTATPTPRHTPLFASDAEALAAATEAYARYVRDLDKAFRDYDTSPLRNSAIDSALAEAIKSVNEYKNQGKKFVGSSSIDTVSAPDITGLVSGSTTGQIYACLDVGATDVVDFHGDSAVQVGRATRFPILVSLGFQADGSLAVSREERWEGDDFC